MKVENQWIEQKVIEIFEKNSFRVVDQDETVNNIGLDSLQFINLIIELEDTFEIEIDDDSLYISSIVRVRDFIQYISSQVL